MKISWRRYFHRLASLVLCTVCGASVWHSAVCYALSAYDDATDAVYADGWQGVTHAGSAGGGAQLTSGDNGGFGFTAWNFDSSYTSPGGYNYGNYFDVGTKDIATSGAYNALGTTWHMNNIDNEDAGVVRAGRGFSPLQIGQSIRVVFDNPTERQFFKGYFIRLNGGTGGMNGNLGYKERPATLGGTPVRKMYLSRFEYLDDGEWTIVDADDDGMAPIDESTPTGVFDTDTSAAGAVFQVTRTGDDTYNVLLDPLGPGPSFTLNETFANPGVPVDWIEFTMFNIPTDPLLATDFYIRSMEISDAPGGADADFDGDGDVDGKDFLAWQKGFNLTGQTNNDNGDADGSGKVDAADLAAWRSQFGTPPAMAVASNVPEPAGGAIVIAGATAAWAWRRKT